MSKKGFLSEVTLLARMGSNPNRYFRAISTPLVRASTFVYKTVEELLLYNTPVHTDETYARSGTVTVHELQNAIAVLDNADYCYVVSSGMNAIMLSLLTYLGAGDHLLIADAVYPCTKRFIEEELTRFGIEYTFYPIEFTKKNIAKLIKKNTKVLFIESPSSGTFEVQNIEELVGLAKEHQITTIFDNSWATPLYFKPLDFGVDIAVQSLTKYVCGHSDTILGAITFKKKHFKKMHRAFLNFGTIASPDNCSLALRSLKTLYARLQMHNANGLKVANWLTSHKKVSKVLHPALKDFHNHKIWKKHFKGSTGTFGFVLQNCNKKSVHKFINSLKLFKIGLSWGGYESLIIPYYPSRISQKENNNQKHYIRIHIGLENPDDLINDLDKALKFI